MNPKEHTCKWECLSGTKLICNACNTVSEISDLLKNTEARSKVASKVMVLTEQLRAGELKKDAAECAYLWVRLHNPDAINPTLQQGALLINLQAESEALWSKNKRV